MKILYVIGNYGTSQLNYLQKILNEIKSWPVYVDVIVNTDTTIYVDMDYRTYRAKQNIVTCPPMEILLSTKKTIFDNVDKYDLYIFSENDILITWKNIESWLKCREAIKPLVPGFLRVEYDGYCYDGKWPDRGWYPDLHNPYKWGEVFLRGGYALNRHDNLHQGCYVLDNEALRHVISQPQNTWTGGNHPSGTPNTEQHYGPLERANTDIWMHLDKVIPVLDLKDFSVWHMPNKYIGIIGSSLTNLIDGI